MAGTIHDGSTAALALGTDYGNGVYKDGGLWYYKGQNTGAYNASETLVRDGFSTAQDYANMSFEKAVDYLNDIAAVAQGILPILPINPSLASTEHKIIGFTKQLPVPSDPTWTFNSPGVAPADPTLAVVAPLNIAGAPEFTAQVPTVDLSIAPPLPLNASLPVAPSLPDVNMPSTPTVNLPSVPSLVAINVPVTPLLNLPTFNAVLPNSPLAPSYTFSFAETSYTSTMLSDMRALLSDWLNGAATGLDPAVEQAIWNRGRGREIVAASRKAKEAIRSFAMRGFSKPPGAMSIEIQEALQGEQDASSTLSRDIMIKQADLEQSNRRFAIETAWKVEEGLISYTNQIAARTFEAAKFAQQVTIDIFQQVVSRYQADIQAYAQQVETYKAAIQAELSKLEIFKAELEGQRLIGEINKDSVEIYKARVEAAKSIIDIFKAQVDAANVSAQVNKTRIEAFGAEVNAYGESVRAKAAEYDGYATRLKAEVTKVDVFKSQADAYRSQVDGYRSLVDANVAQKNIEMKIKQELPIELFKARTEAYRTKVSSEAERVRSLSDVFGEKVRLFEAKTQGESARVNAEASVYTAESNVKVSEANLRVEAAKADMQRLVQQIGLLIEAIKAGASVSAQLAASALSGVHLSAGINASASSNESTSRGTSESTSTSYNYSL